MSLTEKYTTECSPCQRSETDLRNALWEISEAAFEHTSLAEAEETIDKVGVLLEMPLAWWTPDVAHPYHCIRAEQFSKNEGWPRELMQVWRKHRVNLYSPFHIRSRFEHLPFVTRPDVDLQHHPCPGYVRANKMVSDIGIAAMLHVPVHLPKGRIALVNWAGKKQPSEIRRLLPQISGELLAIGHVFMRTYAAQFGQSHWRAEERARLTLREWDCLRTLAQGYREAEAAELLNISKTTLRFHIENIVRKLGAKNRTHAVALAAQLGLLGPIGH